MGCTPEPWTTISPTPSNRPACPPCVELQCQSNFSFLQGASHPEELIERAAELGYAALAITDECSLAGVVRAHVEAKALKLPLLIGATFQLRAAPDAAPLSLTLLAQTREGYGNLSELITLARTRAPRANTGWPPTTSPIRPRATRTCATCPNAWPS